MSDDNDNENENENESVKSENDDMDETTLNEERTVLYDSPYMMSSFGDTTNTQTSSDYSQQICQQTQNGSMLNTDDMIRATNIITNTNNVSTTTTTTTTNTVCLGNSLNKLGNMVRHRSHPLSNQDIQIQTQTQRTHRTQTQAQTQTMTHNRNHSNNSYFINNNVTNTNTNANANTNNHRNNVNLLSNKGNLFFFLIFIIAACLCFDT